ncbi:hypothetical protein [Streptomyces iakyrus]|uniref:Uncharacterized protein n=1 Tax=Streptomyces iakyrus TaxID=68219 RepID=A0ABW8FLK7_9ACTN
MHIPLTEPPAAAEAGHLEQQQDATDDGLVGHRTPGIAHEGPPGYGHAGMGGTDQHKVLAAPTPDPDRAPALFPSPQGGA